MELNFKQIQEMDEDKLYQMLLPDLNSIYEDYKFLNIEESDFLRLVIAIIEKSKKYYDEKSSYLDYIKKCFKKMLQYIVKEKLENLDDTLLLLNNYINLNFQETNNYYKAISNLQKISKFFILIQLELTEELLFQLISENKILNSLLEVVVSDKLSNIDDSILPFIRVYCMLNNIKFQEDSSALKYYEYQEYDDSRDSVKMYLDEIGKYKLLTKDEERELAYRVKNGDLDAKKKFVECNLRLVVSIAKRYLNKTDDLVFLDLVQEGNLGLLTAVERYDPNLGYRFSTYASWWIKQYIDRGVKNKSRQIRVPIHKYETIALYKETESRLAIKLGREPFLPEIARAMNVTDEEAEKLRWLQLKEMSLNAFVGEDLESEYIEFVPSDDKLTEDAIVETDEEKIMEKAFFASKLTKREIEVLKLRFGFNDNVPRTLEAIASNYSLTRERVRQIQNAGLEKLKNSLPLLILAYEKGYLKDDSLIVELESKINESKEIKKIEFDSVLDFLSKTMRDLKKDYENQKGIVKILMDSKLSKNEIDFIILHYGFRLPINEISLKYDLHFSKYFETIMNKKIKKSDYYAEIQEYLDSPNKILADFDCPIPTSPKTRLIDKEYESIDIQVVNWDLIKDELIDRIIDMEILKYIKEARIELVKGFIKDRFKEVLGNLTSKEILITYLKSRKHSIIQIAKLLKINKKEVLEISKRTITLCKNTFKQLIDEEYLNSSVKPKEKNINN